MDNSNLHACMGGQNVVNRSMSTLFAVPRDIVSLVISLGERERAHLVVQLGRAVCMYLCIYVFMYVFIRCPCTVYQIPLISKCLYVDLF